MIWEMPRVKNSSMKERTEGSLKAREYRKTPPKLLLSSDKDQNQAANSKMVHPNHRGPRSESTKTETTYI